MKKLVFAAMAMGCAGVILAQQSQATFRMADMDQMNKTKSSDLGRWYWGLTPGFMWFEHDMNVRNTGYGALHFGYDYSDVFTFEFGGIFAPSLQYNKHAKHGDAHWSAEGLTYRWKGRGQLYGLTADTLMHINRDSRWFDPYLIVGAGVYGSNEKIFGDNHMAFVPRLGVGVMSHLTDNLAIRADAIAQCFVNDDAEFAGGFQIGLVYNFGGDDNGGKNNQNAEKKLALGAGEAVAPAAVAVAPAPRKDGLVAKTVDGDSVKYEYDLNFAYDSKVINPKYFAELDQAVDTLKANPAATASIEGHTDRKTGSNENYNKTLSTDRAKAVEDYLVGKGIDRKRLTSKGFGYDKPKVTTDLKNGNPENRRVEINIKGVTK